MTWFGMWHSEKSFLEACWTGLLFSPMASSFSARQDTWTPTMPSILKTLSIILFISHLTTHKKNMGLYSEAEKEAQPCSRWGNPRGSPAISRQQSPILVRCPHCYTHEVAESTKPTPSASPGGQHNPLAQLSCVMVRGGRSRQKQSSRPSKCFP